MSRLKSADFINQKPVEVLKESYYTIGFLVSRESPDLKDGQFDMNRLK